MQKSRFSREWNKVSDSRDLNFKTLAVIPEQNKIKQLPCTSHDGMTGIFERLHSNIIRLLTLDLTPSTVHLTEAKFRAILNRVV